MTAVRYTGVPQDHTGYGSANRAFITALHVAGVDVDVDLSVMVKEHTDYGWEGKLCHRLTNRDIPYKIKIIHLTPDMYSRHIEKGIYHIGHLFWETDRLPQKWADYCNQLQEIWTSSPHMERLLKQSGVKVPVYSFPQPIDISLAHKRYEKFSILQHKGFLFYSVFQWIERKNPRVLLEAYWEEFKGEENVSLLIKTFRLNYDAVERQKIRDDIFQWKAEMGLREVPRTLLATDILSDDDMMRLHVTGDCFVLPHRGEGWNRCIHEALLMSKTLIATARGGIHEYIHEPEYFGINSEYVPVTEVPWIQFYTKDQMWADVDKNHLRKLMRFVFENREEAHAKGIHAQDYVINHFSYQRVGALMKERLDKINKSL